MKFTDILVEPCILEKLIELATGKDVLEIGTFLGGTAKAMATTARHVTTVDNYSGGWATEVPTLEQVQCNLADEIEAGKVTVIKADSTDPSLRSGCYDMVFIDGCHNYEVVRQDIDLALSVLRPNGIIAGHDLQLSEVRRAVWEMVGAVQTVGSYPLWWTQKDDMKDTRFCHGGSVGDLIASLAPLSQLGRKIEFYINSKAHDHWRIQPQVAQSLLRLLEVQPYISKCGICDGNAGLFDLDGWRINWRSFRNLSDMQSEFLGLPHVNRETKWLFVPKPQKVARVIVARSPRYHNPLFPWRQLLDRYGKEAVFVGSHDEYCAFVEKFGAISYWRTPTYLDLAEVIEGAELCIVNQSSPNWICEALKRPKILESVPRDHWAWNCEVIRSNCWTITDNTLLETLPNVLQ